jgi:hypothetical protein
MKKLFTSILILLSLSTLAQKAVIWYDPITVADKTYGNLHPRVTLNGDYHPLVLWGDPNGKAFLAKWKGQEFAEPIQINPAASHVFTEPWAGPEMTSHGDTIYIVYKELPEETSHIFIKHSYDGGKNFSIETQVDDSTDYITRFPTVAIDPYGNPLVAFMKLDQKYNNPRYVVAKSKDLGESFSGEIAIVDNSGGMVSDCCPATVAESGNATIILYRDNFGGLRNIWAGISHNAAISFEKGIQVDQTNWMTKVCPANAPHGVIVGDTLYTVYMSGARDSDLVYLSKTSVTTLAVSSAPVTGEFTGLTSQNFPRIANSGNATVMVWQQAVSGANQVCMQFSNDITTGLPATYDTVATGTFENIDVAIGGGHIYVVYEDDSSGKVMCRIGRYEETQVNRQLAENTTIALTPAANGKYFTVALKDIKSCLMVDQQGIEHEPDVKCGKNQCKIFTEELDPGLYIVRIFCNDDKAYTYKYEVKEIKEKEEKERK